MKSGKWSMRTMMRYTLLQLPALIMILLVMVLLRHWFTVPLWAFWTVTAVWLLKDLVLYPFVWRAYEKTSAHAMAGRTGRTVTLLSPTGTVRVGGELWRARTHEGKSSIEKDCDVRVAAVEGLTLIVEPTGGEKNES